MKLMFARFCDAPGQYEVRERILGRIRKKQCGESEKVYELWIEIVHMNLHVRWATVLEQPLMGYISSYVVGTRGVSVNER